MRRFRLRLPVLGLAMVVAVSGLSACSRKERPCAPDNVAMAAFAAPPRPRTPAPVKTGTRPTPGRPTTKAAIPTAATRTTTATVKPTAPTATKLPTPVPVKTGKVRRQLAGESAYYPVPVTRQAEVNIVIAQDAVRKQIVKPHRLTKQSKHTSPVTKRTYIYHSDDAYKPSVPQDLYDPFDPRNWTHPFSPFNLQTFYVAGYAMNATDNPLNGDYMDDEGYEKELTPYSSEAEQPDC